MSGVVMSDTSLQKNSHPVRIRVGLGVVVFGVLILVLGVEPGLIGLDRDPAIGFLQIAVFLVGLAIICLGGYVSLNSLWNGTEKTIAADIGFRLVATGYVVCVASGMADVFGFGHHHFPQIPSFGPVQAMGVIVGELIIALGFLLLIPRPQQRNR
jgi:hypothetical protein